MTFKCLEIVNESRAQKQQSQSKGHLFVSPPCPILNYY